MSRFTVEFSGQVTFPERPDDRGSVDVWLLNEIADIIKNGPETDDIFSNLRLKWVEKVK